MERIIDFAEESTFIQIASSLTGCGAVAALIPPVLIAVAIADNFQLELLFAFFKWQNSKKKN